MAGPTDDQIAAAVATAQQSAPDFAAIGALLRKAIARAIIAGDGGVDLPAQAVGMDGTTTTFLDLDRAARLAAWCERQASGGIVPQYAALRDRHDPAWGS
jgi:hypothetical protein